MRFVSPLRRSLRLVEDGAGGSLGRPYRRLPRGAPPCKLVVMSERSNKSPSAAPEEEELPLFLGDDYVANVLPPILCVHIERSSEAAASDHAADERCLSEADLWKGEREKPAP